MWAIKSQIKINQIKKKITKSVLVPLGLMAVALATDAASQKKIFGSGTTALIISINEMKNMLKIVYFNS